MDIKEFFEASDPVTEFENELKDMAYKTGVTYRRHLNEWLGFFDLTHQGFYDQIKEVYLSDPTIAQKGLERMWSEFYRQDIKSGTHPNTVTSKKRAVNSFLKANGFNLKVNGRIGQSVDYKGQEILTHDQIDQLLNMVGNNARLRALILVLKDSGLRVSDVANLQIEDFYNAIERDKYGRKFAFWKQDETTQKMKVNAKVPLGPEAVEAVEYYIQGRRTGPIFLTSKGMPHKDEEGIFNVDVGFTEKGAPMTGDNISTTIRNLTRHYKKGGLNVSAHSLRKFFITNLSTKVPLEAVKMMCGKKVKLSDATYLHYRSKLSEWYMENYDDTLAIKERTVEQRTQELEERIRLLEDKIFHQDQLLYDIFEKEGKPAEISGIPAKITTIVDEEGRERQVLTINREDLRRDLEEYKERSRREGSYESPEEIRARAEKHRKKFEQIKRQSETQGYKRASRR